MTDRWRWR